MKTGVITIKIVMEGNTIEFQSEFESLKQRVIDIYIKNHFELYKDQFPVMDIYEKISMEIKEFFKIDISSGQIRNIVKDYEKS